MTDLSVDDNGNARPQLVAFEQAVFDPWKLLLQLLYYLANRLACQLDAFLTACQILQQRRYPHICHADGYLSSSAAVIRPGDIGRVVNRTPVAR